MILPQLKSEKNVCAAYAEHLGQFRFKLGVQKYFEYYHMGAYHNFS